MLAELLAPSLDRWTYSVLLPVGTFPAGPGLDLRRGLVYVRLWLDLTQCFFELDRRIANRSGDQSSSSRETHACQGVSKSVMGRYRMPEHQSGLHP